MIFVIRQLLALLLSFLFTSGVFVPKSLEIDNIPEKAEDSIRIVTFNVRYKDDDYGSVQGRGQLISAAMKQYAPDSFGVQEATPEWIELLTANLGDTYGCVSQMRDDSESPEASAVFYLKAKYNLVDSGTMWLSDTPDVFASKFEGSGCSRIATWAVLENKETGDIYAHINTHLDNAGEEIRSAQVGVFETKINEFKAKGYPVVCTGDFNTREGSDTYNKMTGILCDTKYLAKNSDKGTTYPDYGLNALSREPIDYIFVTEGTRVDTYKIIDERISCMYLSDHAGICADIKF